MSDTGIWGRESGVPKDSMEAHRLWSNMHAITPKDYRLNSNIPYHPGRYMLISGEILLLKLIRGNAGEFNFYTLDRAARRNGWRDLNDGYLLGVFYSLIDRKYVLAKKNRRSNRTPLLDNRCRRSRTARSYRKQTIIIISAIELHQPPTLKMNLPCSLSAGAG